MPKGRPRVFDKSQAPSLRKLLEIPDSATERSLQNRLYGGRAAQTVTGNAKLHWLHPPDGSCYKRKTLLSQLGRVNNPTAREVFAVRLCELQPTTQDGVRMLRRWDQRFQTIAAAHIADNEPVDALKIATLACKPRREPATR